MYILMHTYMNSCVYHMVYTYLSLTYLYMNNTIHTYIGKHLTLHIEQQGLL